MKDQQNESGIGLDARRSEIIHIWEANQWLYILIGVPIGLLLAPIINGYVSNFFEFLVNLIPEATGIAFGVFVIDRLYKYHERQRILKSVKNEIVFNISQMVSPIGNQIVPSISFAYTFRSNYGKTGLSGTTEADSKSIRSLVHFVVLGTKAPNFETHFIDSALISDVFLASNFLADDDTISIYEALFELRKNIVERKDFEKQLSSARNLILELAGRMDDNEVRSINNYDMLIPMACANCEENILTLAAAIIQAFDKGTNVIKKPNLKPRHPIKEQAEEIAKESANMIDTLNWLRSQKQSNS